MLFFNCAMSNDLLYFLQPNCGAPEKMDISKNSKSAGIELPSLSGPSKGSGDSFYSAVHRPATKEAQQPQAQRTSIEVDQPMSEFGNHSGIGIDKLRQIKQQTHDTYQENAEKDARKLEAQKGLNDRWSGGYMPADESRPFEKSLISGNSIELQSIQLSVF